MILADIHANAPALRAVLSKADSLRPDAILSLGDQINYGPMPVETMALLKDCGARLLMGNHEERILRLRAGDPSLRGDYNWSMLRWTAAQVPGEALDFPLEETVGDCLLTHAVPGDLNRLVRSRETKVMEEILAGLPQSRLVCGHNHAPWRHAFRGKEFVCPGSLGMLEDERGGRASFALLTDSGVETFSLAYDLKPLKAAFVQSGVAQAAPEFSRVMLQTMHTGAKELGLNFVEAAKKVAQETGLPWHCRESFRLAAERFPWTQDLSCEEFWQRS